MKRSISFIIGLILLVGLVWGVAAGHDTTVAQNNHTINFRTSATGSITGTVTDGITPLPNILVDLYILDPEYHVSPIVIESTYTNGSGYYEFIELEDDNYTVGFTDESGNYASEYYDDNRYYISYLNLPIIGGNTLSNIDAILTISSHIIGRVTDAANGNPLAGATASAFDSSTSEWSYTHTDSDGYYTISNILQGSYTVSFSSATHVIQYYDHASVSSDATPVIVGTGATVVSIDASLTEGGSITGRVTAEDGITPLENITVQRGESYAANVTITDANGEYIFEGLYAGNYRLCFFDGAGLYQGECYDNVADINSATDIPVVLAQTTANINASLAEVQLLPIAVQDAATTTLNTPITIDVLANDSNPNNDPLTISTVGNPSHGTASIFGNKVIYAPYSNYTGTDSFTYNISDGQGGSASALVTITIANEQQIDVNPTQEGTAVITTADYNLTIDIPTDALPSQASKLVYRGLDTPTSRPPGTSANIQFTLTLLDAVGQEIPNPTFDAPLSVTIQYNPAFLPANMNETDIQVYFFNTFAQTWESIPVLSRNPGTNTLVIELTHFTEFALADPLKVFLPMIIN